MQHAAVHACCCPCMLLSMHTPIPLLQSDPSNRALCAAHNGVCMYVRVSTHALQLSTRTVVLVSQSSTTLLPLLQYQHLGASHIMHTRTHARVEVATAVSSSQVLARSDSLSLWLACLDARRSAIPSALLPWRLRPKPRQIPEPPRHGRSRPAAAGASASPADRWCRQCHLR